MTDQVRTGQAALEHVDGTGPMDLSRPVWAAENTVLRRVEPSDWEVVLALESSSSYQRAWERVTAPRSPDNCREWLKQEAAKGPLDDNFFLAITDRQHRGMVGCVNTTQADPVAGRFYLGMAVAPEHQRKGYAWEAGLLVLGYMFGERRYQKAQAYVHDFNKVSQAGMLAFGATLEGRLRRHDYFGGRYHDNLIFGLTAEEFFAAHGTPRGGAGIRSQPESPASPRVTVQA
ncbi:GNAT family N-acetyltransferase [Streptomyces sp. NBC_00162]|uniref:GNAT family N-acetyltransferase n=1 Tax=Streptomyces sp. NBC_00162 TaxID=2903629 RepID=UPI00214AC52A|nr:GNAT family N-acetyltransferase [Streptomyces sp. NBC_00162]UUU38146.1 GNAT family N-acetyltransferase [Streptomyces sp. NBC_00162]